ncbi:MAG: hypothetical protein Q9219_005607 [cf. Caloplaca sp. 3 TL-2023]
MEGAPTGKKPRGRPPKTQSQQMATMSLDGPYPQLPPPSEKSSRPSSPGKKGSPNRQRGDVTLDQQKANAAITLQDLGICNPPVYLRSMREAVDLAEIPTSARDLYRLLTKKSSAFIPLEVKETYNGEADIREPPSDQEYMGTGEMLFAHHMLPTLKQIVDQIREDAEDNNKLGPHEGQWTSLVSSVLFIWYLKRREHNWDPTLPMPGIAVWGHVWKCYLFVPQGKQLSMIGPIRFGDTSTLSGTWQVFHSMFALMQWGRTVYRNWFDTEVMAWARRLIEEED